MNGPASRRAVLAGLGALPLAGAARAAGEAEPPREDPIIAARRNWLAAHARYHAHASLDHTPDDIESAMWGEVQQAEQQAIQAHATSLPGAITALEWVEAELREDHDPDLSGDRLLLSLVTSVLGVLRMLEVRHG